jgi:hypothetical protein
MFKKSVSIAFKKMLRLVALPLLVAVSSPLAWAQPVVGQTYKEVLPMGSGTSVPLPEGSWKSTLSDSFSKPGEAWEVYVLKNLLPDAKVPYLVVRQETLPGKWGPSNCHKNLPNPFMVDTHGTTASELLQKCSLMSSIGEFQDWKNMDKWTNQGGKDWWKPAMPGLAEQNPPFKTSVLVIEMSVLQYNGRYLRVEAFVLPPKGMSAAKFRDDFRAGEIRPEHDMLKAWTSIYVESIQQSYFNKKPQAIMALAYPVRTLADAQGPQSPATAVVASNAPAPSAAATPSVPVAAPAVTVPAVSVPEPVKVAAAPVPKVESASPPAPVKAAPVAPAPAPVVVAAAAPETKPANAVSAADNAEKIRLEQERKAIEEDKRKMAVQLEAMTQMLAKLQQENALAAKAKEAAAAAPAALVEPAAPAKPVTFANRKALVIGNDQYTDVSPLNNAASDADAMAKSLELVGYKVFKHHNLTEKKFKQAVRDFRQQLNGGDEVLFFYAGHGVQLGSANYLLPIDVKGEGEDQIKDDAILLQKVLDDMEEKKTKFALAVIDACRDNPFKGKGRALGGRGLAPTTAATGQMIMFSAGSGQQALDRLGDNDKEKNGLFTRIFVKEMLKPGLSVDRVLRNVRNEVVRLAKSVGHEQTPALYDQAVGEFYFKQ